MIRRKGGSSTKYTSQLKLLLHNQAYPHILYYTSFPSSFPFYPFLPFPQCSIRKSFPSPKLSSLHQDLMQVIPLVALHLLSKPTRPNSVRKNTFIRSSCSLTCITSDFFSKSPDDLSKSTKLLYIDACCLLQILSIRQDSTRPRVPNTGGLQ